MVYLAKKTNAQRVRQQDTFAAGGRYNPFSTRRDALGGANNDFKAHNDCFMMEKVG